MSVVNSNEAGVGNKNKPYINDEIDLFELWHSIWSQKNLILIIVLLTSLFGTIYAFNITPVYQSEAVIGKPQPHAINEVDFSSLSEITDIVLTPDSIYRQFLENIDNTKVIQKFTEVNEFSQYYFEDLSLSTAGAIDRFYEDFSIILPSVDNKYFINESRAILHFNTRDSLLSRQALEHLLQIASDNTKTQIIRNLHTSLIAQKKTLQKNYQLENKRITEELSAEIDRLKEKDMLELMRLKQQMMRYAKRN